jgi:hypothetical protein
MPLSSVLLSQFFFKKRTRKIARSQRRADRKKQRVLARRRAMNLAFGSHSKVIDMLARCSPTSLPASRYAVSVPIGRKFSIIDAPRETIQLICAFAKALKKGQRISHVKFHHELLEGYELAANAILDLVAVERKVELRSRATTIKMTVAGNYPRDPHVKRFIKAMGIIKHMGLHHEAPPEAETKRLKFFDARNKNYRLNPDSRSADYKDVQQRKFVDFIDDCLGCNKWVLSDEGKHKLGQYTGEILANAEDHAEFIDWSVLGYLDNGADVPTCEIAIFNFGKSIAETLQALDRTSLAWDRLRPYLEAHTANGFFDKKWREQDLLTVVALQQHISSKNTEVDDSRGQGTVYFIDFFQQMHDICIEKGVKGRATMSVVSGGTCILFDGTYRLIEQADGNKVIAFNSDNDLRLAPDPKYVQAMEGVHFPGTIISVRFPLSLGQGTMVEEKPDENDEH